MAEPRGLLMSFDPPPSEYGALAKSFHWLIVILLAAQFAIGWSMPHIGPRTQPETLINLHFSTGALIMIAVLARLAWRLTHPVPLLVDDARPWQQRLAVATHVILYALLLIIPVLGWMSASGRGFTVSLYGLLDLPPILPTKHPWTSPLGDIHNLLSNYVLLGFVGLHVVAALYHHFLLRDRTLVRMLPRLG
jgi:cytochrome b561